MLRSFFALEEGQGLIEYALIIALVAIALIAGLQLLAPPINAIFGSVADTLNNAGS